MNQRADLTNLIRQQGRLHDYADELRERATEDLIDRIFAGRHRLSVADVLDCAYDASLSNVQEIGSLLGRFCNSYGDARIEAGSDLESAVRKMVAEFVERDPARIEERAQELHAEDGC